MEVIDAQVHVWEEDHPGRPWSTGRDEALGVAPKGGDPFRHEGVITDADLLREMDELGVDAAVLVTSATHYGLDNSYALEAAARSRGRLGVVGRVDPLAPDLEEQVAGWRDRPGALGLRVMAISEEDRDRLRAGSYDALFAALQRHEVPLYFFPPRHLPEVERVATGFPELQLVIDHLGLPQPPMAGVESEPFRRLPELLALARYQNVAVKLSGAPTLSAEPFPYADLWPHIHRVLAAFGPGRVLWGTDWTRTQGLVSFGDGLRYIRDSDELSEHEKELVLGKSLRRILRWQP